MSKVSLGARCAGSWCDLACGDSRLKTSDLEVKQTSLWRDVCDRMGLLIECPFFSLSVINGHTLCLRLLLEIADNPEVVDVKDAKGQ